MKQRLLKMTLTIFLMLLLVLPAQAADNGINHISDVAGLLTEEEWESLEQQARDMTETYGFGVYAIAVDDYEAFAYGDIADAAGLLYEEYALGVGESRDGLLLLLSMAERDYCLLAGGDFGEYAFSGYGREKLAEFFLDDFGDNDWYNGFSDYLRWCETYLDEAKAGTPFSKDNPPVDDAGRVKAVLTAIAAVLLIPLVAAGIVIFVLGSKMKTVAAATQATAYIKGNLILTDSRDCYTHTTQVRQKVKSESSGSSSGNTTSGKF